jgi:hypothetical protein
MIGSAGALAKCIGIAALAVALHGVPALSQDMDGFVTPSGNIHCVYFGYDDAGLRCGIDQVSNKLPPRPADCDLDWGTEFWLGIKAKRAERICHGDTSAGAYPVLPYGATWTRPGIVCQSERTGVSCRNAQGAGFELSRARQRLF